MENKDSRPIGTHGTYLRHIPFSPPDITAEEAAEVAAALNSGWITTGPRTKLLERRLAAFIATGRNDMDCAAPEALDKYSHRLVCLNSATAAEELNLRVLGIGPNDEVIVPAYTYTATAAAVLHCGAKVVFVDIRREGDQKTHSPEMDYEALEKAVTSRTKAIVAVDIGGIVCDYDKLLAIAKSKQKFFTPLNDFSTPLLALASRIQQTMGRIAIIADAAHALGASRIISGGGDKKDKRYVGAIADFTSFSFHAVKNFTTAEGGASAWLSLPGIDDREIYQMYQLLSLHGQSKDALTKTKAGAWEYDIVGPWYKCNMTDIMAAMGLRQLDRYPKLINRRAQIISAYDKCADELGLFHLIHHTKEMDSANHLYLIRVPQINEATRNRIIKEMAECGIATNVHYKPLPLMTAYKEMSGGIEHYPNAYAYYKNLLSLPLHTLLSDEDVEYVCKCLKGAVGNVMNNRQTEKWGGYCLARKTKLINSIRLIGSGNTVITDTYRQNMRAA